jgi:hypothetical protein
MEIEYKKILLKELLFGCPKGLALNNCLTRELRKLPLGKRVKIVDELETEEIDFIIKNHRKCRLKRESE